MIIRWVESSDFGPKSDDLGYRILKQDFTPSDCAKSDCITGPSLIQIENKNQKLESDCIIISLGLISMRIRFRASDFGLVAKINIIRAKSKHAFLCGDGTRVIRFFAPVIQQLGSWVGKFKPTSTTASPAPRRVHFARPWTLDSSIQAYAQTLVWPRGDVPRRFTWYFFST